MQTLSNASVKASDAAHTIEGVIESIEDEGLGLYKVNYKDNIIDAYNASKSTFVPGDIVCVLIPEGDNSKTKIILGAVAPSAEMEVDEDLKDDYYIIDDNFLEDFGDFNLCTYHSSEEEISSAKAGESFYNYITNNNHRDYVLSAYIKTSMPESQKSNGNYGVILYIPVLQDPGTGVPKTDDSQKQQAFFNLDINTIEGNPYSLTEWSFQKIKFSIMENFIYDNTREPKLEIFVRDFYQDSGEHPADIFIKNISLNPIKIFQEEEKQGYYLSLVSDKGLYFVENSSETKTLSPVLRVNGKKTKIENIYDCYWFKKNCNINTTSENYSQIGGIGWECLNNKTNIAINEDGKETFQQVTNIYTLEVKKQDIETSLEYKCVLIKNNFKQDSSIIIYNTESDKKCYLTSATGSNSYIKNTGNISLIATLEQAGMPSGTDIEVAQERRTPEGNYLSVDNFKPIEEKYSDGKYTLNIEFPASDVQDINIIECTFNKIGINSYGLLEKKILGSAALTIITDEEPTYKIYIQDGDVLYLYDANGNSPFVADYAYPTSVPRFIKPITFKIYKPDGNELSDLEYKYCNTTQKIPKTTSLFKSVKNYDGGTTPKERDGFQVVEGTGNFGITYDLADIYNAKKTANYMTVSVNFDNILLSETANIKIKKEGEDGSNGAKYTAIVTYNGNGYGEIKDDKVQKFQLGYNGSNQYYASAPGNSVQKIIEDISFPFNVKVYCNEISSENQDPVLDPNEYSVSQSIFDSNCDVPMPVLIAENNKNIKIRKDSEGNFYDQKGTASTTIVQAIISVGNESKIQDKDKDGKEVPKENQKETIYAYYPVELIYIGEAIEPSSDFYFPHIADGYDKVLYASDCTNPQYDSTNPFKFVNPLDNLNLDLDQDYTLLQSATKNFNIVGKNNESVCTIRPITKFDSGLTLNAISVNFSISDSVINEINNKISDNVNQIIEKEVLRTKYEESKLKIVGNENIDSVYKKLEEFNAYIKKNLEKKENFNLSVFINYRTYALSTLEDLLSLSKQINNYIIKEFKQDTYYNSALNGIVPKRRELQNLNVTTYTPFDEIKTNDTALKNAFGITSFNKTQKKTLKNYVLMLNDLYKNYNKYISGVATHLNTYKENILNPFNNLLITLGINDDIIGFKNLSDQYNAIKIRLTNPIPNFGGGSCLDEQNYIEEVYPNEYPLYRTANDITLLLSIVNDLFEKNNLNKDYQEEYYNNKITLINKEIEELENENTDLTKLIDNYEHTNIIIYKPIPLILNRYEFANLNGQDGSKLYIDENDQYMLAPQVGAGIKNDDNSFTGIVMGIRSFATDNTNAHHIGLFAFDSGEQTYFLNARDGSAIMGKSGDGQIIIDPSENQGLLYNSSYFNNVGFDLDGKPKSYNNIGKIAEGRVGMLINLTAPYIHFADATGKIYSGGHETISTDADGFYLSNDGLAIGSKVKITKEGIAYFGTKAINAAEENSNKKFQTINGGNADTDNSYIAYNTTEFNKKSSSVYIGTNGISLGLNKFHVDETGKLYSADGEIGGWIISPSELSKGNIHIKSSSIYCGENEDNPKQSIRSTGKANFTDVTITGGSLNINNNAKIDTNGNATFNNITCNSIFTISNGTNKFTHEGFSFNGSYGASGNSQSIGNGSFILSNSQGQPYMEMASTGLRLDGKKVKMKTDTGEEVMADYIESLAVGSLSANYVKSNELESKIAGITTLHTQTIISGLIYSDGLYVKRNNRNYSAIIQGEKRACTIIDEGVSKTVTITINGIIDE